MRAIAKYLLSGSVAAFGIAHGASAQTTTVASATPVESVSEVVVTAQHRSESLQQVPISITAMTGSALANANITETSQLSNLTPGLLVQRSVIGKIYIRGIGTENVTVAGDPGVAVHSDGVYIARSSGGLFDLFDVDRVETLRGPQGTLYGRNATGGVINVIPNVPVGQFQAHAEGELGNYNERRFTGDVNAPITDDVAIRISGLGNWRDGFTKNTNADAESRGFGTLDGKDLYAWRAQIGKTSGGPLSARLLFEDINDNSNLAAYKYLNRPNALPNADFGGFGPNDYRTINQPYELAIPGSGYSVGTNKDVFKTHQFGSALHLGYDFGAVKLTSITGYRDTVFNWLNDGDGSNVFFVNYIQQDKSKQYSEELRFNGGGGWLEWMVGGYFFKEDSSSLIALPFPSGLNLPFYITSVGTASTTAEAGFGELNIRPIDKLKITIGGRYSSEDRGANYVYTVNFGAPLVTHPDAKATYTAFTPRFVADYTITDDMNAYVSATEGFKSGGFNLLALQPNYQPESVWAYEVGLKSQWLHRLLTVNADAFYYDYSDIQVSQVVNLSNVLTNAAAATVKGVELEVAAHPTADFNLGGTFAFLDATYDKFCTGDPTKPTYGSAAGAASGFPTTPDAGCVAADPINLKGNTFPRAPKYTLTFNGSYRWPLADGSALTLRGDARFQSLTYFTQFDRPLISQEGFWMANARLSWALKDHRTTISLFANNIFDKTYFTEVLESGAFNPQLVGQAYLGAPRTFGINATHDF